MNTRRVISSLKYLQVTMQDVSGVNILQSSENLIQEVLNVIDSQGLFAVDNSVQIRFHQILSKD